MHEYSLVRSLIRQVESILDDESGTATEVHVSIGPLSGVEPMLVELAFDQLSPTSRLAGSALRIEETDLRARCCDCNHEFVVPSFVFECPQCDSRQVHVVSGDDFRLISISVEDTEEPAAAKPR
jgi:hydrogenase nickel incorporation protein HypA/HybF